MANFNQNTLSSLIAAGVLTQADAEKLQRKAVRIQKKAAKARKKQKVIDVKEVKFRPNIDTNDFYIKIKSVIKFLSAGDKVKITLRYRGREMAHRELGTKVLNSIKEETKLRSKVELEPKLEGRQAIMILAPEDKTGKEKLNEK